MSDAASFDGRRFTFHAEGASPLVPGDLTLIDAGIDGRYLGQVLDRETTASGDHVGIGSVLSALNASNEPIRAVRRPFAKASAQAASVELLQSLQASSGAGIPIGTWRSGQVETPALLRAQGFNRHTFLCGQSGSGKTYALGVILEQLVLNTSLRMVILDPNADFARLGDTLPNAPEAEAAAIAATDIRVLRPGPGEDSLRARFVNMSPRSKAAVMRLDPLVDRGEYHEFIKMMDGATNAGLGTLIESLVKAGADGIALAERIENLGILEWDVWARDRPSAVEVMNSGARITVMDLGGFEDPAEPLAVSLEMLDSLWENRQSRTPTLIVIDEAHNVCPAEPGNALASAVVNRLIQIAAEGRKFGLWLLLSTQRPSKLHPQVLSQCDNLALMRMNSPADVAELAELFGFTPPAMLRAAPSFAQGEVLLAGGFVPAPSFVQMGERLTHEGGKDVKVPV